MDRRASLQWMLAAASGTLSSAAAPLRAATPRKAQRIGADPDLTKTYAAGELWPLTFTAKERACAAALCALIIPADERSPSAADVKVHTFIDEWVSAPYPEHAKDKALIRRGLAGLDAQARQRFGQPFAQAAPEQQAQLADALCTAPAGGGDAAPSATADLKDMQRFFARFRDLAAGGFYTTPEGMKDLGYVGNVPSKTFDGPPQAVLHIVGLLPIKKDPS